MSADPQSRQESGDPSIDQALETCSYCPKLCRASCPVATVEKTEVAVPSFKMQVARQTRSGVLELNESAARVFYKCTSCLHSRSVCRHHVNVDTPFREARQRAVKAGVAPPSIHDLLQKFTRHGSPFSLSLEDQLTELKAALKLPERIGKAPLLYAPSCSSLARDPGEVRASLRLFEQLYGEDARASSLGCCGYPLYAAGHQQAFERQARKYYEALLLNIEAKDAQSRVVVSSPTCAWTLRHAYPELGYRLPAVLVTAQALDQALDHAKDRLQALPSGQEAQTVLYHDACFQGRRLGHYDEARRVIGHVFGVWPKEFERTRTDSPCSGAGGNYRWTHPEESVAIAREALSHAPEDRKEQVLVSECPSARRQFQRADPEQRCLSLPELLEQALFDV